MKKGIGMHPDDIEGVDWVLLKSPYVKKGKPVFMELDTVLKAKQSEQVHGTDATFVTVAVEEKVLKEQGE